MIGVWPRHSVLIIVRDVWEWERSEPNWELLVDDECKVGALLTLPPPHRWSQEQPTQSYISPVSVSPATCTIITPLISTLICRHHQTVSPDCVTTLQTRPPIFTLVTPTIDWYRSYLLNSLTTIQTVQTALFPVSDSAQEIFLDSNIFREQLRRQIRFHKRSTSFYSCCFSRSNFNNIDQAYGLQNWECRPGWGLASQ